MARRRFHTSCPSWDASFANRIQATASCNPAIPATIPGDPDTIWNAVTNPEGVRCDARQQLVNQLGVDPRTADGCFLDPTQTAPTLQPGGLTATGSSGPCETVYPVHSDPRLVAGQPEDLSTLTCALQPIEWNNYPVTFTPAEKTGLESAFPNGVCDYRRPGPEQQPPIGPWLNYSGGTTPLRRRRVPLTRTRRVHSPPRSRPARAGALAVRQGAHGGTDAL